MTAIAGAGIIGAALYSTRKNKNTNDVQQRRSKAEETRELGLGSAGVGGNRMTGGPANAAALSGPDRDSDQQVTTAGSKKELPSGGIGGQGGSGSMSEKSGWASSILKTGGKGTADRRDQEGLHETRGISKMGSETPSKRGPADASH
ncbi:hypothetical protein TARUN_6377 [Trichoderma arundinaceum]|uniref:Uncharacterized protein n=1 Tax=Trichoderma arundinaceum TaxID=490622 RepID=A0A395NIY9_TRIAR|nr:hypothetical protein TARUN_6377 [Trichoderma arundinaceum]